MQNYSNIRFFGGPLNGQRREVFSTTTMYVADPAEFLADELVEEAMAGVGDSSAAKVTLMGPNTFAAKCAETQPVIYQRHVIQCIGHTHVFSEDVMVTEEPGWPERIIKDINSRMPPSWRFPVPIKVPIKNSSFIRWVAYDSREKCLDVGIETSGATSIYRYWDVDMDDVLHLLGAESVGTYYNDHIKGQFLEMKLPYSRWQVVNS